jgi:hypothetical protein
MTPREILPAAQLDLHFSSQEPLMLPQDKQRELAMALADLLLNATVSESAEPDKEDRQ